MKWVKRILITLGVILIAFIGLSVFVHNANKDKSKGPSITFTSGDKKVIAYTSGSLNKKVDDNGNTVVTLDGRHVIIVSKNSKDMISVNGELRPWPTSILRISSREDGTLSIEEADK